MIGSMSVEDSPRVYVIVASLCVWSYRDEYVAADSVKFVFSLAAD